MTPVADEPIHASLRDLDQSVHLAVAELRAVKQHYQAMDDLRSRGRSWQQTLDAVELPDGVPQFNRRVGDVIDAAGRLTRTTVAVLIAEGVPRQRIAKLLGVSHQRVSQIAKDARARTGTR
jgi:uncharacterized NAD(P)/FAD-binding protein YdhS